MLRSVETHRPWLLYYCRGKINLVCQHGPQHPRPITSSRLRRCPGSETTTCPTRSGAPDCYTSAFAADHSSTSACPRPACVSYTCMPSWQRRQPVQQRLWFVQGLSTANRQKRRRSDGYQHASECPVRRTEPRVRQPSEMSRLPGILKLYQ
jgi:hypothetical protein